MEELLNNISSALNGNVWLAPLFALIGGILTSLMPCSLSTVPLVIGCVGGGSTKGQRAFWLSLLFAIGSTITFVSLGIAASFAGLLLENVSLTTSQGRKRGRPSKATTVIPETDIATGTGTSKARKHTKKSCSIRK